MHSLRFWVNFFILVWLNFNFAISLNETAIEGRIIHGKNASILDHAHVAAIQIIKKDFSSYICGSSVLNQKFLLTAAHCVDVKINFTILAFAGHNDIRKAPVSRLALTAILHQKYEFKGNNVYNDIALVFLSKDLPLGANIKRVIMERKFPKSVTVTLAGWGITNEATMEGTELLKFLTQRVYGKKCGELPVQRGMFCAGSMKSSDPTPSLGDSGSGLITSNFHIIGILSYKTPKHPALSFYSNVSYFYPWIKKSMRSYCKKD